MMSAFINLEMNRYARIQIGGENLSSDYTRIAFLFLGFYSGGIHGFDPGLFWSAHRF